MSLRLFPRFAAGLTRPTAHPRSMVRHVATTACRASPTRSPPPRVGSQQFFTPLRPKASFGSSTTHSAARSSWAPVSFTSTFLRRAFATGRGPRPGYIQMGGRRPPPPGFLEKLRRRADSWDPTKVVYALIAINVGIYLLWKYAVYSYQRFGDASLFNAMYKNLVTSEANIKAGRIWTLITSAFSQRGDSHMLMNGMGLYFVGPAVATSLGSAAFLSLYVAGGFLASIASLTFHHLRGVDPRVGSEGASGAIYTCLAFFGAMYPQAQFMLFFIVPMPAWLLLSGMFGYEGYQVVANPNRKTDSAGHLGGLLTGVAAAYALRRGHFRRFFRL